MKTDLEKVEQFLKTLWQMDKKNMPAFVLKSWKAERESLPATVKEALTYRCSEYEQHEALADLERWQRGTAIEGDEG